MDVSRRRALQEMIFGAGLVGLRALATGIPPGLLLHPERALAGRAQDASTAAREPQYLIFSTSTNGDPVNANVPGTYNINGIYHANDPYMAATSFQMGSQSVVGAKVWSTLPASTLAQTCFFHHATYTIVHPDEARTLRVQGATKNGAMQPSWLAKNLAAPLGTLRAQPVNLNVYDGSAAIEYEGALQPAWTPAAMANSLALPGSGLADPNLVKLRDNTLDALNKWAKTKGKAFQSNFLDAYALSQNQLRSTQDQLVSQLRAIGNATDAGAQIRAALVLFKLGVTPVVTLSLPFGGDNHFDNTNYLLDGESAAHQASTALLATLEANVAAAGLTGKVTFASSNVFGRSLFITSGTGRDHNANHSVGVMIGANVKGGVVGGVAVNSQNAPFAAMDIDSTTGVGQTGADVPFAETFGAYAKTMAAAVGLSDEVIGANFSNASTGKIVAGALAS